MSHSRILTTAAVLTLGVYMVSPAVAGGMSTGKNGGGGHTTIIKNGGGGGGNTTTIVCVLNGQRFIVQDIRLCGHRRQVTYSYHAHASYAGGYSCGCEGGYRGGYSYTGRVSLAARMQTEHRGQSYMMNDGGYNMGGYGGGYAMGECGCGDAGYGGGNYAMEGRGLYVSRRHHKMRHHRHWGDDGMYGDSGVGFGGGYDYDPGYVIHYGPTISKDGGY